MHRRSVLASALVVSVVVFLTLWLAPRPVYELWEAERVADASSRFRELFPGGLPEPSSPEAGEKLVRDLAQANGIPSGNLPPLGEGAQLFDADNDGDLDLFMPMAAQPVSAGEGTHLAANQNDAEGRFRLYLNDGTGHLREVGAQMGPAFTAARSARAPSGGRGSWCLDVDRDGKQDLVLRLQDGSWLVLWNRFAERHFVRILVRSSARREAAGQEYVRVELLAGGKEQVQLLRPPKSPEPDQKQIVHFGLGKLERAEKVFVLWPSGCGVELQGVPANHDHEVVEPLGAAPGAPR